MLTPSSDTTATHGTPHSDTERSVRRALAEAELLNSIAVAASTEDDLAGILASALNYIRLIIPFTGGSIALVEDDFLVVRAALGPFASQALGQRLPRSTGRSWQVIEEGQPVLLRDVSAQGATPTTPVRSFLAVPLLWRGTAFGLLEVDSTEPDAFEPDDTRLLQRVAAAVSGPVQLAQRREAEQHARAVAEEAVRARDVFLGVAAHELKTPVTSMRGYAQLILRALDRTGTVEPTRLRSAMRTIDQQAEKLGRLMTQLLDVTRLDAGRFMLETQPADVVKLCLDAVLGLRTHLEGHRVCVQVGDRVLLDSASGADPSAGWEPVTCPVDATRIEQVLVNLLDNAVKFSPPGTRIELTVRAAEGHATIAVRDYGPGVAPEMRQHLFQRFFQAHGDGYRGGMGLGLYLSRQIAERHGGSLVLESPEGGGTRLLLTLPRETGRLP